MADFMDLLQGQLSDNLMGTLSSSVGIGDVKKTQQASSAILSLLTNALAKNSGTPDGLSALTSALDRDHDGSYLDDLASMFMGATEKANPRTTNGVGILNHLLGANQYGAIDAISRSFGLNNSNTASLMVKLAPMVLGMLGKQKRQQNLSQNGLAGLLSNTVQNRAPQPTSIFNRLLDADGDGSIVDEVASLGMKTLGSLFSK